MTIRTEPYLAQVKRWPIAGRHIMAQFDSDQVVVYQAYRPEIGNFAVSNQRFGGEFSFSRMSWVKPNFLWMMYRCGWATKPGQEIVLAVHLKREGFGEILRSAVHSSYQPDLYSSPEIWRESLARSPVRLQWDPDHDPAGTNQERRAIQLGLAGDLLRRYSHEWIIRIEDITDFVRAQRENVLSESIERLQTPSEDVYPVDDPEIAARVGITKGT